MVTGSLYHVGAGTSRGSGGSTRRSPHEVRGGRKRIKSVRIDFQEQRRDFKSGLLILFLYNPCDLEKVENLILIPPI